MALDSGGHPVKDEYGTIDHMTPHQALVTDEGMTVAIYLTKPPTKGRNNQEIHLLRMTWAPPDVLHVFNARD